MRVRPTIQRMKPLLVYLFCMGAPILLGHLLFTLYYRVQPNWIAAGIVPTFCLMVIYWEQHWREGGRHIKPWLIGAIVIGLVPVILLHDTNLIAKLTGYSLPAERDPLHRVRGWRETADVVAQAREELRKEGKEVFVICAHYGLVGELTFYWPEAKARVKDRPLVFYQTAERPENQFYFWPGYVNRVGENAIYIQEEDPGQTIPASVAQEFNSIQDLGLRQIPYRGGVGRELRLYACRNLRERAAAAH